jgi:hypothetical protein
MIVKEKTHPHTPPPPPPLNLYTLSFLPLLVLFFVLTARA